MMKTAPMRRDLAWSGLKQLSACAARQLVSTGAAAWPTPPSRSAGAKAGAMTCPNVAIAARQAATVRCASATHLN